MTYLSSPILMNISNKTGNPNTYIERLSWIRTRKKNFQTRRILKRFIVMKQKSLWNNVFQRRNIELLTLLRIQHELFKAINLYDSK